MDPLCFTFDLDWAPDFMVDDLRRLIVEHRLPATVFCTHQSDAVRRLLATDGVETAVHPNFLLPADDEDLLRAARDDFPAARGMRSHALYFHSRLLPPLHRLGFFYLSNELAFLQPGLCPRHDFSGLVRLPVYWEDDVHCVYFDGDFALARLALESPGLKVLNFHPVHLFLNTARLPDYMATKQHHRDESWARDHRVKGPGVRGIFLELAADPGPRPLASLGQVARDFARKEPYTGNYKAFLDSQGGGTQ